jgi:hypothetical protein
MQVSATSVRRSIFESDPKFPAGGVYKIKTETEKVGERSRAVSLKEINPGQKTKAAEFSESQIIYKTGK